MEKDESRAVYLEEGIEGPSYVRIGKELGISRQARDGLWLSGKVWVEVGLKCHQTEKGIGVMMSIAEDLADSKAIELLAEAEERIDRACEEESDY